MRYFLDTSFAIDFLRNADAAVQRLANLVEGGDQPFISDIVVCELATGARSDEDRAVTSFITAVEFVQPGPEVARLAGRWRGEARRRGLTLSVPDALIAATTDALGAVLITRNLRDFSMTPISVDTY